MNRGKISLEESKTIIVFPNLKDIRQIGVI